MYPFQRHKEYASGDYKIGRKKHFFRSRWEANVALYLESLKKQKAITEWQYEPCTFWFEKIKRGVVSYKPDFLVFYKNGESKFIEVKGWMDNRSKTKLKRMAKYYPGVTVELWDSKVYKSILKDNNLNWFK